MCSSDLWPELNHPSIATRMPVPHGNPPAGRASVYMRHADRVTGVLLPRRLRAALVACAPLATGATRLVPAGAKHWWASSVQMVAVSHPSFSLPVPVRFLFPARLSGPTTGRAGFFVHKGGT